MDTQEWNWKTSDGLEIYSKAWMPLGDARGVICLVHGLGEHIGRYQPDGEALTDRGYILAGFDQRGFGRSEGQRGHTPSLEAYFNDIYSFQAEVARRYPGLPRFLYGHSMGGVLVLAYTPVRQPQLVGVVATGPGLRTSIQEQKVKVALSKILGKVYPTLTMKSGLDPRTFSRDPHVKEEVENDPLCHGMATASWGQAMMGALDLAYQNAPRFPNPLLLMHGSKDELAYPSGSQMYADLAPKDKLTFKIWDGYMHELHTDPENAPVFKYMIDWLDAQLAKESANLR